MYLNDLIGLLEKELAMTPAEDATIPERETAILAEVRRLKQAKDGPAPADLRPKAATAEHVSAVSRAVIQEMLDGHSVRATALKWKISEPQCKRVFFQRVRAACRREINRRQALVEAGELHWLVSIHSLRFVSQASEADILGKARDAYLLVDEALSRLYAAADELQKFTMEAGL